MRLSFINLNLFRASYFELFVLDALYAIARDRSYPPHIFHPPTVESFNFKSRTVSALNATMHEPGETHQAVRTGY